MPAQSLAGRLRILEGSLRSCAALAQGQGLPTLSSELYKLCDAIADSAERAAAATPEA